MTQYDNTNSGALFKNDDKREGKSDPDYKGSVNVNGVDYWVSSWVNTSKAGQKYMSLKLKAKEPRQESAAPVNKPVDTAFVDDDMTDIPF